MQGRKPKPDTVKTLTGNPGKRPLKSGNKASNNTAPALLMPKDLPSEAQKEWDRVVPKLKKAGVINGYDLAALTDYCQCVARLRECENKVTELGILVQGDRGWVKNPALQLAREYRNAIHKWCSEFGLTPSSRGRMNIPNVPDEKDEFEEFLNGGGDDDEDGDDDSYEDA